MSPWPIQITYFDNTGHASATHSPTPVLPILRRRGSWGVLSFHGVAIRAVRTPQTTLMSAFSRNSRFMTKPQENVKTWTLATTLGSLKWLLLAAVLLGALLLLASPNYRWDADKGDSPYGSDFLQDWTGANMLVSGQSERLYDSASFDAWQHDPARIGFTWDANGYYPTVYPPPYYLLASPLGWINYRVGVILWLAILLVCLVTAIAITENRLRKKLTEHCSQFLFPALLLFPPVLLSLTTGQKGAVWLLIWGVTWGLLEGKRPLAAGLVFGLMSIKPTLFFLLPLVMLYHRQWRFVIGASLSFGGLWLATACILPLNVWPDFLAVARGAGNYHHHAGYQLDWSCNLLSLVSGMEQTLLPAWANYLLIGVLASFVLSRTFFTGISRFDASQGPHLASVLIATCLLSPHFYVYDLVVLLLPIRLLWSSHRMHAALLISAVWFGMMASQLCHDTIGLPLMPIVLLGSLYSMSTVTPGQSSVRKGVSGNPAPSNMLQTGLSPQA